MALTTYSNLKAAIEDWSHRNDVNSKLDDFIDMAEAEIWNHLRVRDMEARATNTASTRFLALPDGFLQMRRLQLSSGDNYYDIHSATPESMQITASSGRPKYFTVTTQLEFDRTPDSSYTIEMQYYRKLTALSAGNTTNDILTNYPTIYLYGGLWALYQWANEEERAEYYWNKFLAAIADANAKDKKGRHGPAPRLKIEGSTP